MNATAVFGVLQYGYGSVPGQLWCGAPWAACTAQRSPIQFIKSSGQHSTQAAGVPLAPVCQGWMYVLCGVGHVCCDRTWACSTGKCSTAGLAGCPCTTWVVAGAWFGCLHSATVPEHWSQAHPALLLGASGLREQRQGGSSVNSSGIILNPCVCGTDAASVAARLQLCSHMGVTQLGRSARQGVSRKTGGCQQCRWRHNCDLPAQPSAECLAGLLPL
jgi:hypothetical protein